ncbi:MAG: metallophosphoesterase [Candidatus Paceibacterota bacterium]
MRAASVCRLMALTWIVFGCLVFAIAQPGNAAPLWSQDFDSLPAGAAIGEQPNWSAFPGFSGEPPRTVVAEKAGARGSRGLTVAHNGSFRTDNWGLHVHLPAPLEKGVVWLQCRVRTSQNWDDGFYFDARGERSVVARIAAAPVKPENENDAPQVRWHASWHVSYWRLYSLAPPSDDGWYRLTMRLDLDARSYAVWVDDRRLADDLPLCDGGPVRKLFFGINGTADSPGVIDDVVVMREPPSDLQRPPLLPRPKHDLVFRFAAVGDPQYGFAGYDSDQVRFEWAVRQINDSGAELTIVLGDMVHDNDNETAYRDVAASAAKLKNPVYFVRGNHDAPALYEKYFHKSSKFSVEHTGFRFMIVDATGNHTGIGGDQLDWIEQELQAATAAEQDAVVCLHVSPWQDNERGRGQYNQIGDGRDRLLDLMGQHRVPLCLAGHYHRGLWHAQVDRTHCLVLGGTALCKHGHTGWCVFDVYPDRIEMHQKPLFFAYESKPAEQFYNLPYSRWDSYDEVKQQFPHLQNGPLVIKRLPRQQSLADEDP